jgi:ribosomal protein L37E
MKGRCNICGAQTWHRDAKTCRACYLKQLGSQVAAANHEWDHFTSTNPQQGRDRAGRRKQLGACERCGKPAIDRHHIDDNPLNNDPANLVGLCRRCHMQLDGRMAKLQTLHKK